MSLKKLDAQSFEEKIYENGEKCLVIFSRKSCHVCKEVVPALEELALNYEGDFGFYYVDVEDNKELYQAFSLRGVPQLLFFNEGEYCGKFAGEVEEEQVQTKISEILG